MTTAPPMAYFGGKTTLAGRIAAMIPPHEHYLEPFAGSLAVLLAKPMTRMETVNDLDGNLMTFWRVLRDRPDDLARACILTPHARAEHQLTHALEDLTGLDDVERARIVFTRINQGRSGTLRKTGWRHFVAPRGSSIGMPGYLEAYVDRMAAAAERMQHVSLECRPALELVETYGRKAGIAMYVDPPYPASTRSANSYATEMGSDAEHADLLDALLACTCAVVLSGYANDLYDDALRGWERVEIQTMTGNGGSNQARTEVLWSNRPITEPTLWEAAP